MKIIGLITARGGSKGIPGKNIKILGDKPLLYYTIKAALDSNLLNKIVVSTDCEDIASVAIQYGASAPFIRPIEYAKDNSTSVDVVRHALEFFKNNGENFDAVCLLQPTSPFRPFGYIDECIKKFINSRADSCVSLRQVPHEYNPHWTFKIDETGFINISTGDKVLIPRRQELPKAYYRDGSVYISKTSMVLENKKLIGNSCVGMISNSPFHVNLDTVSDWAKAEQNLLEYQNMYLKKGSY